MEGSERPGAVQLWNVLHREEREKATRWYLKSEKDGRRRIDEEVAAATRTSSQTIRDWPLRRICRKMGTMALRDKQLARLLLLRSIETPERLIMASSFLDGLDVPHVEGRVRKPRELDAPRDKIANAASTTAEEFGDRALGIYLLTLRVIGAPLAEKSMAWLKDRWDFNEAERGTQAVEPGPQVAADPQTEAADVAAAQQVQAAPPLVQKDADGPGVAAATPVPVPAEVATAKSRSPGSPVQAPLASPARQASLTALDQLIVKAVEDCAENTLGALTEGAIDEATEEFLRLNSARHESFFVAGYRDVRLGRSAEESAGAWNQATRQWYWAGALHAWALREQWDLIASEYDTNSIVSDLLAGSFPASAVAALPIVRALHRVGRTAEISGALTDAALIRDPDLFRLLHDLATDHLHDGRADLARGLFELLVRVGKEMETQETLTEPRQLLDARRRLAHCLRALDEHGRAKELLEGLLVEDPEPSTRAMVLADLGMLAGGFNSLTDAALPDSETAAKNFRDRLAKGEEQFRQSVEEQTDFSAHGHYCLGVLALARDEDEAAERHLNLAHAHFSRHPQSYGVLVARSSLYAAIAKARQLQPEQTANAARIIVRALDSRARFPVHLIGDTINAFELADLRKKSLRNVTEAIIQANRGAVRPVLDELVACGAALRHCPLLAERLHSQANLSGRSADLRAADLRLAVQGYMYAQRYDEAKDALDDLERLARERVAIAEFQELLTDPNRFDPAWSREDAIIARARCHEVLQEYEAATDLLRKLFHQRASQDSEFGLDDAEGILERIRGYPVDEAYYKGMSGRLQAMRLQTVAPEENGTARLRRPRPVSILIVGGAEDQAKIEKRVLETLERRAPHIEATFVLTGWGSSWNRALPELERHANNHDGLVIMRFVRTNLGRHIRKLWPGHLPWRFCWGGGRGAIVETVQKVAALVQGE